MLESSRECDNESTKNKNKTTWCNKPHSANEFVINYAIWRYSSATTAPHRSPPHEQFRLTFGRVISRTTIRAVFDCSNSWGENCAKTQLKKNPIFDQLATPLTQILFWHFDTYSSREGEEQSKNESKTQQKILRYLASLFIPLISFEWNKCKINAIWRSLPSLWFKCLLATVLTRR